MTWKVLDWKIQYDLTSGKTIQYEAVGRVLDCSPQVRSLGFSIQQFFSLWIGIPTLYGNKLARNIFRRFVLKNLAQQICYHHVGMEFFVESVHTPCYRLSFLWTSEALSQPSLNCKSFSWFFSQFISIYYSPLNSSTLY